MDCLDSRQLESRETMLVIRPDGRIEVEIYRTICLATMTTVFIENLRLQ